MDIQTFIARFAGQQAFSTLLPAIQAKGSGVILLKGLSGSSRSVTAAATLQQTKNTHWFILTDREEAAFFYDDLYNLLVQEGNPSPEVLFFPSSFKRDGRSADEDPSGIVQRTKVLNALSLNEAKNGLCIVSYPEAIAEKVVGGEYLKSNTLQLKVNENVGRDFISEALTEYAFERTDFVSEPGQYAIRGSIIDIFSFSANKPYRIDFFGDTVDSIRSFDLNTQLSVDNLNQVEIIPNLNFNRAEAKQLPFHLSGNDSLLWIGHPELLTAKLHELSEKAGLPEAFMNSREVTSELKQHKLILFTQSATFKANEEIEFHTAPQPTFNKNFELLANNIIENKKNNYDTFIIADNPKQFERLRQIFESISTEAVDFESINSSLHEGFVDHVTQTCLYTDHQLFQRYHRFKLRGEVEKGESFTIQEIQNLHIGDYVVHIDHGIGTFGGLVRTEVNGKQQELIKLIYKDGDVLFVNIHGLHRISKYKGKEGEPPRLYKLGGNAWQKLKQATKKKVKDIAKDLILLYAKRKSTSGFAYSPDSFMQHELEASFIYEDTPDQLKTTQAVKEDMEMPIPMDRLVCGDVGFGKTEIAIRAAFKAVCDNKQVAVLVPTTVLALQHYKTFKERLKDFPVEIALISRLKHGKDIKTALKETEEGKIGILIGTHRILGKDVKFKDLGLLIIDEEQKFGVTAKEKLRQLRHNVDTLTLTATPIPRTLQFSLLGARDLSVINTPPPNRHPIVTEIHSFNEDIIREAIEYEISRGGQVFFVHNRVQNIKDIEDMIRRICPGVRTIIAHGQMPAEELENHMMDFINGDYDVLVATTIIESGLDIPNANTIIINQAQNFGLSDLHQLRGRVGRSNKKAFCYLLTPPPAVLTSDARRRLKAIEEFSDLGSGFNIAMQDLDIRGAGNLLGGEQSGFIADIGFEAYQQILNEALTELKSEISATLEEGGWEPNALPMANQKSDVYLTDCYIDTDMEALLPDEYIGNTAEKIRLYKELDNMKDEESINAFRNKLTDRFGKIPEPAEELFNIVRLRLLAIRLGFEKIILKNGIMVTYFVFNQQSGYYQSPLFAHILQRIQSRPNQFKVKESSGKLSLTSPNITSINQAITRLSLLLN